MAEERPNPQPINIDSLRILNYRSCIDTHIDLQPDLSVLIGPNGTGKTTILNAFLLLKLLSTERPHFGQTDPILNPSSLRAVFTSHGKKINLRTTLQLRTDEHNHDVLLASDQQWTSKELTGDSRVRRFPIWLMENEMFHRMQGIENLPPRLEPAVKAIAAFVRDLKYYSASQFTNPSLCPVSFEVEQEGLRRRPIEPRGHGRFLYDLHKSRQTPNYHRFIEVIGGSGIGLIDDVRFKEIPISSIDYQVRSGGEIQQRTHERILVVPQFVIGRSTLSPNQLSDGTFKTITLLFYLMTQESSALLIEEPEVCVHHGLLSSIVELIKLYSRQKQIIVSTHSDFVLDQIEPRHVYMVARSPEHGTEISNVSKSLSPPEANALKHYLDQEGNLGEYWRHGGLN